MKRAGNSSVPKVGTYAEKKQQTNEAQQISNAMDCIAQRRAFPLADALALMIPHWIDK